MKSKIYIKKIRPEITECRIIQIEKKLKGKNKNDKV